MANTEWHPSLPLSDAIRPPPGGKNGPKQGRRHREACKRGAGAPVLAFSGDEVVVVELGGVVVVELLLLTHLHLIYGTNGRM